MSMNLSAIGKIFYTCVAVLAGWVTWLFGGWDTGVATLLAFMIVDFALGVINSWLFCNSPKTTGGGFSSAECWKGLTKKFGSLAVIVIAHRLDVLMGANYIRDACVICYILNESFSMIETLALMGVPIPIQITRALELLKQDNDQSGGANEHQNESDKE